MKTKIHRNESYLTVNADPFPHEFVLKISASDEGRFYIRDVTTYIDTGTGTGNIHIDVGNIGPNKKMLIDEDFLAINEGISWEGEYPLKAGDTIEVNLKGGTINDKLYISFTIEERDS